MDCNNVRCETIGVLLCVLAKAIKMEMDLAGEILSTLLLFEGLITHTWLKRLWISLMKYW